MRADIPLNPFAFWWAIVERVFGFGPHAALMRTIREDTREIIKQREQRQADMAQAIANRDRQAMRDLRRRLPK